MQTVERTKWQQIKARMAVDPEYRARHLAERRAAYKANPERQRARTREAQRKVLAREKAEKLHGKKYIIAGIRGREIKRRAKRKGLTFAIDGMVFDVPERCPLAGIPLDGRDLHHTPSIDRIDNSRGYEPGNIWVISLWANTVKQNLDIETAKRRLARKTLH